MSVGQNEQFNLYLWGHFTFTTLKYSWINKNNQLLGCTIRFFFFQLIQISDNNLLLTANTSKTASDSTIFNFKKKFIISSLCICEDKRCVFSVFIGISQTNLKGACSNLLLRVCRGYACQVLDPYRLMSNERLIAHVDHHNILI